ncbi:MAG: hypothetical protein K0R66_1657 [Gammaproteobacteria bacterium]|jgi:hypothetical protein|nr:hypothetical protein [Gammaproteobacteria bacterium]
MKSLIKIFALVFIFQIANAQTRQCIDSFG